MRIQPKAEASRTVEWQFYAEDEYAYGDCEAFGSYFNFDDLQVGDFVGQYQEINGVFKQFQRAGWASYLIQAEASDLGLVYVYS